ncbi:hypothetical protein [Beijerinckia sp. L45]|uniref:hypothetical protein n=1 Tax=Beijerinckia sp. L45 TaxID=1641855 RepID=UPI001AEE9904|nr:hypothetical protein [Beijerinckia sp. L45]
MAMALLGLSGANASAAGSADQCRDILIYAAHNRYQSLQTGNIKSDLKTAMCNGTSSSDGSSSSIGAGLSVLGYGSGTFDKGKQNLKTAQSQICSSGESQLSNDQFDQVAKDVVDADSVAAWTKCIGSGGLVGSIERNGDIVIFHLQWIGLNSIDSTELVNTDIDGVNCQTIWPDGTHVGSLKLQKQCHGDAKKAITVTFQAKNDSLTLKSPGASDLSPTPPDNRTRREKCLDGMSDECVLYADDIRKDCDAKYSQATLAGASQWRICAQTTVNVSDYVNSLTAKDEACKNNISAMQCKTAEEFSLGRRKVLTGEGAMVSAPLGGAPFNPTPGFLPPH